MNCLHIFKAIAFSLHVAVSVAITTCPTLETTYTGAGGATYAICLGTDYQGTTLNAIQGVTSITACAKLCDASGACVKGVYDAVSRTCHIKDNTTTLTWAVSTNYDTIRLNNKLLEGTNIAYCPFPETAYSSTFIICPDTDYKGATSQAFANVANVTACAQRCVALTGCEKAVFDSINLICHIKDTFNNATLIWTMNKQFDTIHKPKMVRFASEGNWTDIIRLPIIPVASYIVPEYPESSRMLVFSSWGDDTFGSASGYTQFADYNFKTGAISQREISNTDHDMFCPGMSSLADGRLVISGGSDAEAVSIYHPVNNSFTRAADMKVARGYQSSVTLSDGKVFTIGGSYSGARGGKDGEIYDPEADTWTLLPGALVEPMLTTDAEGIWREDNHAWLFSWTNRSVFQAGPSTKQHWYGTFGNGSVVEAGTRDTSDAMCGINVMYDAEAGKILTSGGSQDYTNSAATQRAHITTIGAPGAASTVERVADMSYPRGFSNAVVLPDGKILVTGGQRKSLVFSDTDGILSPELFDPITKAWKLMTMEAVARNYHSTSLLLADGRVWSGGGGLCYVSSPAASAANCDRSVDHADGQIFSPPYLFNNDNSLATRPIISILSTTFATIGGIITVTMSTSAATTFSLVRIGSATHSINSDQRRVPLGNVAKTEATHMISLPVDSGKLVVGYYYLFALSSVGVPSIARTVKITF